MGLNLILVNKQWRRIRREISEGLGFGSRSLLRYNSSTSGVGAVSLHKRSVLMASSSVLEEAPALLCVVLDLDWSYCAIKPTKNEPLSLNTVVDAILVFINAFLLLEHDNQVVVLSTHRDAP